MLSLPQMSPYYTGDLARSVSGQVASRPTMRLLELVLHRSRKV